MGFGLKQKDRVAFTAPIQLQHEGKVGIRDHGTTVLKVLRIIKNPGAGMGRVQLLKESGLADFSRVCKAGIVVGEDMGAWSTLSVLLIDEEKFDQEYLTQIGQP